VLPLPPSLSCPGSVQCCRVFWAADTDAREVYLSFPEVCLGTGPGTRLTKPSPTIDYDRVSKVYDQVRSGDPEMVSEILDYVSLSHRSLILDVGCGTANNTLLVSEATGARTVGVDLSMGMLEAAKHKAAEIQFVQAPAENLSFQEKTFDLVFMTEVVHHLPRLDPAIMSMHRVLRAGGRLCIVTQSHAQIDNRMTSRFFPASANVDKGRYPDIPVITMCLEDHGFIAVSALIHMFRPTRLGAEYLKTAESKGYSMLHKIGEAEYQQGLARLRHALSSGEKLDYAAEYTFVWGMKPVT